MALRGNTASTNKASVSVGNTSTEIVAANVDAIGITLINKGNRDVWVDMGDAAVVGEGGIIPKSFGSIDVLFDDHGLSLAINGIVSAGTSDVSYLLMKRV